MAANTQHHQRRAALGSPRPWLPALAALAAVVAGCGGGSQSGGVAHVGSTSPPASSTPAAGGAASGAPSSAQQAQLVKFAQCMRAHGVPDFPDPTNGRLLLRGGAASDLNPSSPAFKSASQDCKSLQPAGLGQGQSASPQLQAKALKFAACMRAHGVPKFPDPSFSGGGVRVQIPAGGGVDPSSPQFQSAQQACRSLAPIAGGAP